MVQVGIPYLVVISTFEQLIELENQTSLGGIEAPRRLEHLQNVIAMLEIFEAAARSGLRNVNATNVAYEQMKTAVASGQFLAVIESCKLKLHNELSVDVSEEVSRLQVLQSASQHYYR